MATVRSLSIGHFAAERRQSAQPCRRGGARRQGRRRLALCRTKTLFSATPMRARLNNMIFHRTTLPDAFLIELEKQGDDRGFFARTMCRQEFAAHGLDEDYVQQSTSFSVHAGTIRGLHFQLPPYTEAKLVRCIEGEIVDIIVDLRRQSPTFMKHEKFVLNDRNRLQLYVPRGFAHSFQAISDNVEVTYL